MGLGGPFADHELGGDLAVGPPGGDELGDLALAQGQGAADQLIAYVAERAAPYEKVREVS